MFWYRYVRSKPANQLARLARLRDDENAFCVDVVWCFDNSSCQCFSGRLSRSRCYIYKIMGSTSHEICYQMTDLLRICPVLISPAFDEAQRSVSCTMLFIVRTDSIVYFPFADSPLQFYRMKKRKLSNEEARGWYIAPQHNAVSTIDNSVCNVSALGSSRARVVLHTFKHLCSNNYWNFKDR